MRYVYVVKEHDDYSHGTELRGVFAREDVALARKRALENRAASGPYASDYFFEVVRLEVEDETSCANCGHNPGHNDVAVECYECDERWVPWKEGDQVRWTLSDFGQDNGEYVVVDVTDREIIIIKNQHGDTVHAKHNQLFTAE